MKTITISTETGETYSSISNFFIDHYMTDANGEFVKVYLYLIRLLSNNTPFTVAQIADHFNLTENDICRAIKYWVSRDVLKLNYDGKGYPTGIVLLPLSRPEHGLEAESDALSILRKPMNASMDDEEYDMTAAAKAPATRPGRRQLTPTTSKVVSDASGHDRMVVESSIPLKQELKQDVLNDLLRNEDWEMLIFGIENTFYNRGLTPAEINSLFYIHNDLGFDEDLIDFLIDYCLRKGKKSWSYIEATARNWYADGIRTVADAKVQCSETAELAKKVLSTLCITDRQASPLEIEFINTWHRDMGFSEELIILACQKAILAKPKSANFKYVNGIIENWNKNGIKTVADVEAEAKTHKEAQKQLISKTSKAANDVNNFSQTDMNKDMAEMEELLLKQVNKKKD